MRRMVRLAVLGAVASASVIAGGTANAVDSTGSVPLVISPCHLNYRVHADVDSKNSPPLSVSGTNAGIVCP